MSDQIEEQQKHGPQMGLKLKIRLTIRLLSLKCTESHDFRDLNDVLRSEVTSGSQIMSSNIPSSSNDGELGQMAP